MTIGTDDNDLNSVLAERMERDPKETQYLNDSDEAVGPDALEPEGEAGEIEELEPEGDGADDAADAGDDESDGHHEPEEGEEGAETPTQDADGEGEADTPIPAPKSWDAAAQAEFAKLPRPLQQTVAKREADRDKALSVAQQKAADASKINPEYQAKLNLAVQNAGRHFKDKWDRTDAEWTQLLRDDPDQYHLDQRLMAADQRELERITRVRDLEDTRRHTQFVEDEGRKLLRLVPELADPEKGPDLHKELGSYLRGLGLSDDDLQWANAAHLHIGWKAMQYDKAMKKNTAKPARPANAQRPPVARPAGGRSGGNSTSQLESLRKKAEASGSLDDTLAYREAKEAAGRRR